MRPVQGCSTRRAEERIVKPSFLVTGLDDARTSFWCKLTESERRLESVSDEELTRSGSNYHDCFVISVILLEHRGVPSPEAQDVIDRALRIQGNLTFEILRRKFALGRAKLFMVRDLPLKELDKVLEVPRIEFVRGFSMNYREGSGKELSEQEAEVLFTKEFEALRKKIDGAST